MEEKAMFEKIAELCEGETDTKKAYTIYPDAGVVLVECKDTYKYMYVFNENIDINALSDDDLEIRCRARESWYYPEFEELIRRSGLSKDEDECGEEFILRCADELGMNVILP